MAAVNKLMLIGNVGKDAVLRYTQSGKAVANFSLAATEKWNATEDTQWSNCVVWGKQAEIADKYVKKGRQIYVEGSVKLNQWKDQQSGEERASLEAKVRNFQLLGKRDDSGYDSGTGYTSQTQSAEEEYDIGDLGDPLDMPDV